jgi:DNA-binding PadR family transcriptional regulator
MDISTKNAGPNAPSEPLLTEAARLRDAATFPQAVRAYTGALARFREAPRIVNKLISYEARFRVTGYLLYLDADTELFAASGGASYKNLHQMCTRRQEVSPRVLKTTLALLKLTGFVATQRSPTDRRSKSYRPTERMAAFVRQWLGYAVASLDALDPDLNRTALLASDPGFIKRFLVSGGRDHASNTPPADLMPDFIAFFGSREGAAAVILAVMQASFDGVPVPARAQIARRFGLSKTQTSNIINEGTRLGYFNQDAGGQLTPTPHLSDSYDRWISIELAFYARHMTPTP